MSGHRHAAASEAFADALDDRLVDVERHSQGTRDRVAGDVIFGRAQAAGGHDHVRPVERTTEQLGNLVDVVSGNHLQPDVDTNFIQPLGNEQRVRVDAERRQQLSADRNDAGFHVIRVIW